MNDQNVVQANFANDPAKMFYADFDMYVKLEGETDYVPAGIMEAEKAFKIEKEYIEFKAGTPKRLIAKDVVEITRTVEGKLKQLQPDFIALLSGGVVDTTDANNVRVVYGTNSVASVRCSIILKGKTRDNKKAELYIRLAEITSESVEFALGGGEYGTIDFKAEPIEDPTPLKTNFAWPLLNSIETTCETTSTSADITVDSATGLTVGMVVYTEDEAIISGAKIIAISGTTVTLDTILDVSDIGEVVKFYDPENVKDDTIAFWLFEK